MPTSVDPSIVDIKPGSDKHGRAIIESFDGLASFGVRVFVRASLQLSLMKLPSRRTSMHGPRFVGGMFSSMDRCRTRVFVNETAAYASWYWRVFMASYDIASVRGGTSSLYSMRFNSCTV